MATDSVTAAAPRPTLQVESLLQIAVGTQVVLSTLLLSMGQQNMTFAVVALVAVTASFIITDLKGYFVLGPDAATVASILACLVLVVQVIRNVDQSQLLNVANILIYLQVILLFQKKEERTYWSLLALSLLQVIVAAALNLGLLFGLLLAVYVLVAVTALTLFFAFRQTRAFLAAAAQYDSAREMRGQQRAGQLAGNSRADERLIVIEGAEPVSRMLNRRFIRQLAWMTLITALLTIVVFFAIPRFSTTAWNPEQGQVATVGFTEEVNLDDISRILESPEQVMRVEFSSQAGEPYQVDGEPYFRGTVLSSYNGSGYWRQYRSETYRPFNSRNYSPQDEWQLVEQRITLQPGSHSVLFNVAPCFPVASTSSGLRLNPYTRQLTLGEERRSSGSNYRYVLGTTAFRNGWQKDLGPVLRPISEMYGDPSFEFLPPAWWRDAYPEITSTAEGVLTQQNLNGAGVFDRAKALEEHFRVSGRYLYSLELNQNRNQQLDPIEDFVANHKTGHCEYFASALTLMLRSQQIPARMVVGYKGGEFNTVGNYYIVRQLHAHAWVEAYLPGDEVPADERDPFDDVEYGVWLRLDPTPNAVDLVADADRFPVLTTMREFADYCQVLWDDYILGLNSSRQQQAIYGPLIRNAQTLFMSLFSYDVWRQRWQTWQSWLHSGRLWQLAIAMGVLGFVLFLSRRLMMRGLRAARQWMLPRSGPSRRRGPRLDLYDQMERILATRGFKRRPHQTPREFAEAIGGQLAEISPVVHVAGVPRRVTHAHYRIRFGQQTLDPDEHRQLKHALHNFERAMNGLPAGAEIQSASTTTGTETTQLKA